MKTVCKLYWKQQYIKWNVSVRNKVCSMKNGVYKWEWGFYGVQVSCIAWEVGLGKRQKEYKTKVLNDIRRKNTTHFFMHR